MRASRLPPPGGSPLLPRPYAGCVHTRTRAKRGWHTAPHPIALAWGAAPGPAGRGAVQDDHVSASSGWVGVWVGVGGRGGAPRCCLTAACPASLPAPPRAAPCVASPAERSSVTSGRRTWTCCRPSTARGARGSGEGGRRRAPRLRRAGPTCVAHVAPRARVRAGMPWMRWGCRATAAQATRWRRAQARARVPAQRPTHPPSPPSTPGADTRGLDRKAAAVQPACPRPTPMTRSTLCSPLPPRSASPPCSRPCCVPCSSAPARSCATHPPVSFTLAGLVKLVGGGEA